MTQQTRPRAATLDHLKKKRKPFVDVYILLEPELEDTWKKAKTDLEAAAAAIARTTSAMEHAQSQGHEGEAERYRSRLPGLEAKEAEAQAAFDAADKAKTKATVRMRVESIGRKKYDALVADHPPTEEQVKEWQEQNPKDDGTPGDSLPEYNGDTFPQALISRCLTSPKLSVDEVEEVTEDWNFSEFMQLFTAAIAVNSASRVIPWGKGSG